MRRMRFKLVLYILDMQSNLSSRPSFGNMALKRISRLNYLHTSMKKNNELYMRCEPHKKSKCFIPPCIIHSLDHPTHNSLMTLDTNGHFFSDGPNFLLDGTDEKKVEENLLSCSHVTCKQEQETEV